MKKHAFILVMAFFLVMSGTLKCQQLNGQTFNFSKGKKEWSDTVYKKLRTKDMVKKGTPAVLLGIRYRYLSTVEAGNWYEIEISNKSADTKVKFNVSSGKDQEVYTVRLDPKQTKVIRKLYWQSRPMGTRTTPSDDNEYLSYPLEDIIENR
jgi:hypothetical protein